MTPYEKLQKQIAGLQGLVMNVADNMYKTEKSNVETLEVIKQMAEGFKSLSEKFDVLAETIKECKKQEPINEGYVMAEEECFGGMLHLLVGFEKEATQVDLDRTKKECVEKYGMNVAFMCKVNERLIEVFLQRNNNEVNINE